MRRWEVVAIGRSVELARAIGLIVVCGCGVRQSGRLTPHELPGQQAVPRSEREVCSLV